MSKEKIPCQYTAYELMERIKQGLKDVNKNLGVSVEEMRGFISHKIYTKK